MNTNNETFPLPNELQGHIKVKVIIKSFHLLQVGDLAAQMTLHGHEGMASFHCIKCNFTQKEWTSKKYR